MESQNACAIPGCTIKYDSFMTCMWRAVSRGYVKRWDAEFVANGLRHGFDCGVDQELAKGRRVFRNYQSAVDARSSVTKAISSRLGKGKSLALGPWASVEAALKTAGIFDYYLFPMGATPKKDSPDPANPVMRPTDDHTRTGLNFITCMDSLRYALKTYAEVAWLLKQNYFMYVADVEDAFLLLPLAPWLWFFMLFRCYLSDDDEEETACVHLCGDFGTRGMPGTFYIFFVKVVVQMGRSELVLTLPMAVYVDDCGIIGDSKPQLDAESTAFMEWSDATCGVKFKVSKRVPGSQEPHMIGFTWDSRTLTRSLGEVKLHSYLTELLACGEARVLTLQQRQQIAGKMQRGAMALPPGAQCFIAHCFSMMHGLLYGHQKRRTSRAERQDYLLFHDLLAFCKGKGYYSYGLFKTGVGGAGDASKSKQYVGGGYVCNDGFYDLFTYGASARRQPIDALEGDVVRRACAERGPLWAGCLVDWRIDNSAFQLSLAKSRSRADRLNDIIRDIMYLQLKYGFVLSTSWIASEDNILPDDLSRDPASGHGEAAFLAAQDTLAEFLAPGAVLQRHPQAGRVVTFADHAHLARELREGASDGRWAAAPLSPPPSPPAMEVGGAPLRLISRAEEREALERAWAEAEAEAAEAELAQQHFARSVAVAEGLATPDSRRALPPTPDAPVREAPTPLRMVREGGADVSPAGAARRRGPTPSSFLPYVSSFEHSSSTSRVGGSLAQQLSVPYARANLFDGLPVEYMERVDQVLDNRLAASSMAKIATAHKRLAAWVVSMMDDTALVFSSISSYVWCIRTWHRLQHQADPVMGVMDWTSFFTGIAVYTAVAAPGVGGA